MAGETNKERARRVYELLKKGDAGSVAAVAAYVLAVARVGLQGVNDDRAVAVRDFVESNIETFKFASVIADGGSSLEEICNIYGESEVVH